MKNKITKKMKKLKASNITRPEYLSEAILKTRPELTVVYLSGEGDPIKTFDEKLEKLYNWLNDRNIKPSGPPMGIYYLDRDEVGVENVIWDACIPINQPLELEGEIGFQILFEAEVVSVTLTGPYDLIGSALRYLKAVSEAYGIKTKWPLTEIYHKVEEEPVTELQLFVEKGIN